MPWTPRKKSTVITLFNCVRSKTVTAWTVLDCTLKQLVKNWKSGVPDIEENRATCGNPPFLLFQIIIQEMDQMKLETERLQKELQTLEKIGKSFIIQIDKKQNGLADDWCHSPIID